MGKKTRAPLAAGVRGVAGLIAEIRAETSACRACASMRPHRKLAPESFGTTRTGYVLVGDAPDGGAEPFADLAGYILREALAAVKDPIYRTLEDLFFLTQAARCVPPSRPGRTRRRAPTPAECRACRPFLSFELRTLHPYVVLAVGARATEAVLGRSVRLTDVHARRQRIRDMEVLPLLSPAPTNRAALKTRDLTPESYARWLTGLFGALIDDLPR